MTESESFALESREHDGSAGLLPEIDPSAYPEGSVALPPADAEPADASLVDIEAVIRAAQAASTPAEAKAALDQVSRAIHETIRMDSNTRITLHNLDLELREKLAALTA